MNLLTKDTIKACEQFGAYTVRKAALSYQDGVKALEKVGLGNYSALYEAVLTISNMAFDRMSDEERYDDFMSTVKHDEPSP
jgi:hypothetical protein